MTLADPALETDAHPVITPRRVSFDFSDVPIHWVPHEPLLSQVMNVAHVLLPPGERWFVEVCREALDHITDDQLRFEVKAFLGQEAIHGRTHAGFQQVMAERGFDTDRDIHNVERYIGWNERMLRRVVGRRRALGFRVAVVAGVEQFTAVLGDWILRTHAVDDGHPVMLDVLRWHGAEEVEHKCVAFDLHQHLNGGSYIYRFVGMVHAATTLGVFWNRITRSLIRQDPAFESRKPRQRDVMRLTRQGRLPGLELVRAIVSYLKPGFHPSNDANLHLARRYLDESPAVRAIA